MARKPIRLFGACTVLGVATLAQPTLAQDTVSGLPEIIVTAQKRTQSINDVGLTVQALSADALQNEGVQGPEDLSKVVPGLTFTKSIFGTPVYTLRGIGLYDATFGAVPAVAIYTDQVPRNFPIMASGLDMDIERVEVLKGPQGTLFGQSSTGGAINYILNKPTQDLESGVDLSYERFDKETMSAFVSGPIGQTLSARLAVMAVQGGAWQYSESRPGDNLGDTRKLESRLTVNWKPTDDLRVENTFTAARDRSDPQAPQLVTSLLDIYSSSALATANANPATRNPYGFVNNALYALLTTPTSPGYYPPYLSDQATVVGRLNGTNPAAAAGAAGLLGTPNPGNNARAAEWTSGFLSPSDNGYFQDSLRGDYTFATDWTLTSISAFAHQKVNYNDSLDGTTAVDGNINLFGSLDTYNEELRVAYETDRIHWIVGGTFDDDQTTQNNDYFLSDYSANAGLITLTRNNFSSQLKSYGVFTDADYKITPQLSANAGVRYTRNDLSATYCYNDPASDAAQGTAYVFQNFLENPPGATPIGPGQCFPISNGDFGTKKGQPTLTPLTPSLDQDNVSFRAGLNYKLDSGTLLYATISQGYKAGLFSEIGASSTSEYTPAVQEKLIDYEAGIKAPLFDNRLNVNAAAFYYDYTNKQVRARIEDPVYGLLEKVINVPKAAEYGAEFDIQAAPVQGLRLTLAGTYLYSEVTSHYSQTPDGYAVYNAQGITGDFKGSALPYTPKFSANADIDYEWSLGRAWAPFVGSNVNYQGPQSTTFTTATLPAPDFEIHGYALLDVRAGIRSPDDKWQVMAYCHNVTNKFYVTSISEYLDTVTRYTGQPAIYGVSVRLRFK